MFHLYSCTVRSTVLLTRQSSKITLKGKFCYLSFTNKETEAEGGKVQ